MSSNLHPEPLLLKADDRSKKSHRSWSSAIVPIASVAAWTLISERTVLKAERTLQLNNNVSMTWENRTTVFAILCVCMCAPCVHPSCTCGGWRSLTCVFLCCAPSYFLRQGLSLNLELMDWQDWLTPDPTVLSFPGLGFQACPATLDVLCRCWRCTHRWTCLLSKNSTHWAICQLWHDKCF